MEHDILSVAVINGNKQSREVHMKFIKGLVVCCMLSVLFIVVGVNARMVEWAIGSVDVPGNHGVASVEPNNPERHDGGKQYAKTNSTHDKVNNGLRAPQARVHSTVTNIFTSDWVNIPNGSDYQSLGDLEFNYYYLQIREKTWSIYGFYWTGYWKINQ